MIATEPITAPAPAHAPTVAGLPPHPAPRFAIGQTVWAKSMAGWRPMTVVGLHFVIEREDVEVVAATTPGGESQCETRWVPQGWEYHLTIHPDDATRETWGWVADAEIRDADPDAWVDAVGSL